MVAARPARSLHVPGLSIADASVAVGTTRLTDLGALWETTTGEEIAGLLVTNVRGMGTHISSVGGIQTYVYALFTGPVSLDAADVFPATASGGHPWWLRRVMVHRGQSHNSGAGGATVQEFDEHRLRFDTRRPRRMARELGGETVWFAEETVGQAQNAAWSFDIRTSE